MSGPPTYGDVNRSGNVNVADLLGVINAWGVCPSSGACCADLNYSGQVDVTDLLMVINNWG